MAATSELLPAKNKNKQEGSHMMARREAVWGLLFLSPWIIGFLAFTFLPMLFSLYLSFTDFTTVRPDAIQFIGLANYRRLLTDPLVRQSLYVTFKFMLISVPVGMIVPLLLAALLNSPKLRATNIFRTLFFMPSMVPLVSAILIWGGMLNTERGWVNNVLVLVGLPRIDWLYSSTWIHFAFVIMGLWGVGNTMLLMLASMQGVPTEYYDAAKVDGAGPVLSFMNITIPLISPIIMYNLTLSLIGTLQYFIVPFVVKNGTGDPGNSTLFFLLYLFKSAFTFQQMGYGATLAWVLFVIGVVITVILFGTARYWVYYAGGER